MLSFHPPEGATWEFMVVFFVVLAGPIVIERFRLPGIIGLLVGGFAIGPHGLGVIASGNTTIPDLGQLGLLYLMFIAGLELDLSLIQIHRRSVGIFAALTFSVPMVLGSIVGFALGWSTPAALLLGSLLASHTLLTYPIIRRAGLTSSPAAATAVGATVITDTLALIVLAAVSGVTTGTGTSLEIGVQLVIGLILLLISTLWLMPKLARLAMRRLGTERSVRYLIALTAFLIAASLSQVFGIENIVGAFFAGLALNRLVPNGGPLMDRVEFFGSAVFIPIFMVSVGLILDPGVMTEPSTLGLALLMIAACMGGKAIAARLTVPLLKFSKTESWMIFSMTAPQAAATLAAVMVGLNIGLFGESVVNASLVVILVSVILSTFVAEGTTRRIGPATSEYRPLGSHVLVALEDPEQALPALYTASWISGPEGGAATIVTVADPRNPDHGSEIQESLGLTAVAAGLDAHVITVHDSSFARGVLNAAASVNASLVLAMIRDEPARAGGSWVEAVAEAAPVPTALLKGDLGRWKSARIYTDDGTEGASGVAEAIGTRIASHLDDEPQQGRLKGEGDNPVPASGEVLIRPVRSWNLLAGLPDVPAGAALIAVPDLPAPVPLPDPASGRVTEAPLAGI